MHQAMFELLHPSHTLFNQLPMTPLLPTPCTTMPDTQTAADRALRTTDAIMSIFDQLAPIAALFAGFYIETPEGENPWTAYEDLGDVAQDIGGAGGALRSKPSRPVKMDYDGMPEVYSKGL